MPWLGMLLQCMLGKLMICHGWEYCYVRLVENLPFLGEYCYFEAVDDLPFLGAPCVLPTLGLMGKSYIYADSDHKAPKIIINANTQFWTITLQLNKKM